MAVSFKTRGCWSLVQIFRLSQHIVSRKRGSLNLSENCDLLYICFILSDTDTCLSMHNIADCKRCAVQTSAPCLRNPINTIYINEANMCEPMRTPALYNSSVTRTQMDFYNVIRLHTVSNSDTQVSVWRRTIQNHLHDWSEHGKVIFTTFLFN